MPDPITARTVSLHDPNLASTLDAVYALYVANFRPWWQCGPTPYPTRDELDRMMVQEAPPLTLVIAESAGELVGFDFHSPEGVLLCGFLRHDPSHRGFTSEYDQWALDVQRAMNDQVRSNTGGTIFHVTYANQSIWYALEVLLGVPRALLPYPQHDGPAPSGFAPYTGPPPS